MKLRPGEPSRRAENADAQRFSLSARDYQLLLQHCTKAEIEVYQELRRAAGRARQEAFLAGGYVVADSRFMEIPNHGRRKSHIANLIAKQVIVPLNPARSRTQLYLLGCTVGGKAFFVSWIQEIETLKVPFEVQSALDSFEVSKRGLRPNVAESLKSLAYKGFMPFSPSDPSSNTDRRKKENSRPPVRPEPSPPKSSAPSRKQVVTLATEISRLAGTPLDARGRSAGQLRDLISDRGFDETLKIVHEAWACTTLLTKEYPTFTAQSVWFYAHYKRHSNRTAAPRVTDLSFETLIEENVTPDGDIDYDRLRNVLNLHRVQRTPMHDAICQEYGLNPALVFDAR